MRARTRTAELQSIWREYHHVEDPFDPPYMPYVTSPGLWRLYQANVTRLDELARTGDLDSARKLVQRFQLLETEMRGVQVRKLGSALGTLAMPILTGEEDPLLTVDPAILKRFDKLWRLSETEQPREWMRWKSEVSDSRTTAGNAAGSSKAPPEKVRPASGTSLPQWLTAQVGGLLLDRVIADPGANLYPGRPAGARLDDSLEFGPRNCTIS